jgi:acyl-CoA thioesterase I
LGGCSKIMNPIALQPANGNLFFVGLIIVATALFLRLWFEGRLSGLVLRIGYIAGIVFVTFSATPLSVWLYCLWFVLCVAAAMVVFYNIFSFQRKLLASFAVLICSIAMFLIELPYHLSPTIKISPQQSIFVIGDSISAGISTKERVWPDTLGDLSHFKVINLAKPAATVETAMDQAAGITDSNSLVLVEIGGNDLLGHTDSKTFYVQLDKLLGRLTAGNNQVVVFELPLLPFCNAFGKVQRNLAAKYGVILLPKHYLTDVFGLKGGTLDGLHLSQKGHDAMANSIYSLIKTN